MPRSSNMPRLVNSPPINRTYSGPRPPVVYDQNWQLYNNLTAEDIAFYEAQPEWQNFKAWVALDPPNATIHADAPAQAVIDAALVAASQPVATQPLPINAGPISN